MYQGEETGPSFVVRAATKDGAPYALPALVLARGDRYSFLPDGDALVVLTGAVPNRNFFRVDLLTGQQRALTDFGGASMIQDFDVSSDGSEIVFDRVTQASDVILIELPEP